MGISRQIWTKMLLEALVHFGDQITRIHQNHLNDDLQRYKPKNISKNYTGVIIKSYREYLDELSGNEFE